MKSVSIGCKTNRKGEIEMDSNLKKQVDSLMSGMENFINTKTVVGEAVHIGDTIILPLVDVNFGLGTGAVEGKKDTNGNTYGAGGLGAKISPSAVLVVQDGHARLVNIKNQDSLTKIIDLVPDIMERFQAGDLNFLKKKGTEKDEKEVEVQEGVED